MHYVYISTLYRVKNQKVDKSKIKKKWKTDFPVPLKIHYSNIAHWYLGGLLYYCKGLQTPAWYIIISLDCCKERRRFACQLHCTNVFVMDRQIEYFTYFSYLYTYREVAFWRMTVDIAKRFDQGWRSSFIYYRVLKQWAKPIVYQILT